MRKILYRTKSGTSLLVALGLTTIIVLVSIGVTTVVISSIRESANVTGANQAYYAAEAALEKGLLVNQDKGAGYSGFEAMADIGALVNPNSKQKANYTISGQVPKETRYGGTQYGIPRPGTGNAWTECDALNPIVNGEFWYVPGTKKFYTANPNLDQWWFPDPTQHPCNWSKIKIGETISIPLYVMTNDPDAQCPLDAASGLKLCNPEDMGLTSVKVYFRTPCNKGNAICADFERYDFDLDHGEVEYGGDDTIVGWDISGTSIDGKESYDLRPLPNYIKGATPPRAAINSEIYESLMNGNKGAEFAPSCHEQYCALSEKAFGQDLNSKKGKISDYLLNAGAFPRADDKRISKPVLKLIVIHSMQEAPGSLIPYLEYRVGLEAANISATDTSQTITAEGYSGSFKQVLEVKNPQDSGVLQYVIQQ